VASSAGRCSNHQHVEATSLKRSRHPAQVRRATKAGLEAHGDRRDAGDGARPARPAARGMDSASGTEHGHPTPQAWLRAGPASPASRPGPAVSGPGSPATTPLDHVPLERDGRGEYAVAKMEAFRSRSPGTLRRPTPRRGALGRKGRVGRRTLRHGSRKRIAPGVRVREPSACSSPARVPAQRVLQPPGDGDDVAGGLRGTSRSAAAQCCCRRCHRRPGGVEVAACRPVSRPHRRTGTPPGRPAPTASPGRAPSGRR
jgi:hypothetical protein